MIEGRGRQGRRGWGQSRVGVEKEGSSRTAEKFSQRQEMRNSAWREGTEEDRERAERGI